MNTGQQKFYYIITSCMYHIIQLNTFNQSEEYQVITPSLVHCVIQYCHDVSFIPHEMPTNTDILVNLNKNVLTFNK